jgi:hypothetical protein
MVGGREMRRGFEPQDGAGPEPPFNDLSRTIVRRLIN